MANIKKKSLLKRIISWVLIILIIVAILATAGVFLIRNFMGNPTQEGEANDTTIVQTVNGKLQGRVNNGVYNFLGVEYAKAERRFQEAKEVEAWDDVKTAFEYGAQSLQSVFLGDIGSLITGATYNNNCQNMNIWTPEIHDNEKRPVMVWLHGGGFTSGSANRYNGENLARYQDVVVVGVNHRLNMMGYLDLSEYGEEYKNSANVGIDDIILSLEWIHENIEAFGGDPDNVTVFGQSGGGAKVLALMMAPKAKGLFHKAIIQSGATETVGVKFTSKEASLALTEKILEDLNITQANIDDIQNVSYDRLMDVGSATLSEIAEEYQIPGPFGGFGMEWEPVVDGEYIVDHPITADGSFANVSQDIPLLIGSTLYEWAFMPSEQVEATSEIREAFKAAYPNEDVRNAGRTDTLIRMPMLNIMTNKADQNGANVYSYLYTYEGAAHGAEIPYVFYNGDNEQMNILMSSIWANFARNGVPSAEGVPTWEAYTRENGACMILDTESYLAHHHDKALLEILEPDYKY